MSNNPFKLRCSLTGHSKDVRSVAVGYFPEECIVSGSRDKTTRLWKPEGSGFVSYQTFGGHDGFVATVAIGLPSNLYPNGTIVTGCQDGKIRIYKPDSSTPMETLSGHTDNVCSIAISKTGLMLSGSWDRTGRVWKDNTSALTLTGHSAAVWAVEIFQEAENVKEILTLTGSADKSIRLWLGNSTLQFFNGHTDCVRALVICDSRRFLSAANDAIIRLWAISGECLSTFYGHANYIYDLALMPNGMNVVSCGEDRTVRLWELDNPKECQQTIFLPAQSVWTVSVLDNGDIVTGSSDGVIRVFTKDPERYASQDVLQNYEEELAATTLNAQQELGGIKISNLPGPESLFEPGTKEGQTKLVRRGETVACYSWSSRENQWNKIGDVIGAAGDSNSGKNLFEGKEYDFVFNVDIEEGMPPLKLPYNVSEDPWMAAQKFIHKHDLSQYYLDTVANFIITNSKRVATTAEPVPPAAFTDPFTGGSRYVPSTSQSVSYPAQSSSSQPMEIESSKVSATPSNLYFPQKDFLRFDQANIEAITKKLREFNNEVEDRFQLSEINLQAFIDLASANSSSSGVSHLPILLHWPSDNLFPVLDIIRLATRDAGKAKQLLSQDENFIEKLINVSSSSVPNCMLAYRTIAHLLMHHSVIPKIVDSWEIILNSMILINESSASSFSKHPQWKNVLIAFSTVILNLVVLLKQQENVTIEMKTHLITTIASIINHLTEEQALFRLLVALGTILYEDTESIAIAESINLSTAIGQLRSSAAKINDCVRYIIALF